MVAVAHLAGSVVSVVAAVVVAVVTVAGPLPSAAEVALSAAHPHSSGVAAAAFVVVAASALDPHFLTWL